MNKKLIPLFLLASTTLLTACVEKNDGGLARATVSKEDAIALVNGKYISKTSLATLEKEIAQRNKGQTIPKEKLVEELIQRELLIQEAVQKKLNESPEYTEQLATVRASLLTQAAVQNFLKSNPVTDADLQVEYDKNVASSASEYKARHILVKTEDEAKQLILELGNGADFAELAKSKSTGPSGPKGGDLGWFAAGQMVAPFSEAVMALEDNKFTLAPVKTQFGYHVILREASRSQTPPPFESIKEKIRPMLQRKKLQDFLKGLREKATVEVLLPEPAPAKADETTGAADEAQSAVDAIATEGSKSVEQAKAVAASTTEKATSKVSEAVETATKEAKAVATDAIEKANNAATEKMTETLNALTK